MTREVGGSTTVNWPSSFRTTEPTPARWRRRYALAYATPEQLAPWFAMVEHRTGVADWLVRIRQIEAKAMSKLRQPSRSDKLKTFLHNQ